MASNVDARDPRMLQDIVGWYDGGDNPLEIVEDDVVDPIALPSLQTCLLYTSPSPRDS